MGVNGALQLRTFVAGLIVASLALVGCRDNRPSIPVGPPAGRPESPTAAAPSPSPSVPGTPEKPALTEVGRFDAPIHLASPPKDPRLFVVEKAGRILVFESGRKLPDPFLDIRDQVSSDGERGLFSIAFAPDYSESGLAYIDYTDRQGHTRIVEYRVDRGNRNRLDPGSRRELLLIEQPYANHNGGYVTFRGNDLIIGMGDGGSGGDPQNRAQNRDVLLGKMLSIDPRRPGGGKPYGIPEGNPFAAGGGAPEILAYGLRNPWRFSFDATSGDLYLADVGQNKFDEVNYVPRAQIPGANFGWRAYEGNARFSGERIDESKLVRPVVTVPISGPTALTGGFVYRGSVNSLKGFFLYGNFYDGIVKGFRIKAGAATDQTVFDALRTQQLASFAEDSAGEMYIVSLEGPVYKIVKG